ncbi:uncharacterized protein LOC112051229 isoform X3 [Bicyclus anynana]|uniref:Uncharacterized protein LOC112051229 isoform X3 n=1 Tax=Bicyclus anynana TaxID=110368 RepID=A0A6J1NF36_BICAN|nr:uncharacterized protein LOC112051229 isoform X3 [Bicyclus anynana]
MWCPKIFLVATMIFLFNSARVNAFGISSFGKANTEPPRPPTTTPSPARACNRQAECLGVSTASCVRTHFDPVTRCLCGDNSPPLNGRCEPVSKSLYHACSNSDECNDGLICFTPNITGVSPLHLRVHAPTDKICQCDTENGYREKEFACSDAEIIQISLLAVALVTCLRKILVN